MTYQDFCNKSNSNLISNTDAQNVFSFLSEPSNIHNMICFSQLELPAITGIVSTLEKNYANTANFPFTDFRNKQIVGKMIKYILSFYGHTPKAKGLDDRAKLRNFSNANYFKTSSVYELTTTPKHKIIVISI